MDQHFTDADISSFLKGLIELGGADVVDDSPDKYIRLRTTGKQEMITVDGRNVPLAIYGTKATDALIINPFAEGEAESTKNIWFYSSRNIVLSSLLVAIMKKLLTVGAETHSKKKTEKDNLETQAVKFLTKHILNVDEKMVKEFETISKELHNFFNIHYNKSTKQGEVKCIIFTQAQRKAFPNVRVKTWEVLEGIMGDILGTNDLSTFNYRPETIGIPVFESFAHILVNVYEHIEEGLKLIDRPAENLGTLKSHLKYMGQYCARAKWCTSVQPNQVQATMQPVAGATPWGVPMSAVPMSGVPGAMVPGMVPTAMYPAGGVPMQMPGAMPMMTPMVGMDMSVANAGVPVVPGMMAMGGMPMAQAAPAAAISGGNPTGNPFVRP